MYTKKSKRILKKIVVTFVAIWFSISMPAVALSQEVTPSPSSTPVASPSPTNAVGQDTGAPTCTGAGCGQGSNQGDNQGTNQGGPTLKDLGAEEDEEGNLVLPEGVEDSRQGAGHGQSHGTGNSTSGSNTNTGPDSNNQVDVDTASSTSNNVNNNANIDAQTGAVGSTGGNASNRNTGSGEIQTGDAGVGVTQVKNANTTNLGGSTGLNVDGHKGSILGDYDIKFGSGTAVLGSTSDGNQQSIRAVNDTTGSDSDNDVKIKTRVEENNDIKNDGTIDNKVDLTAITGDNETTKNTGDGVIKTGDAKVAATLINLLNTNLINGHLWLSVADIFGDLIGNINMENLSSLAAKLGFTKSELVDAVNENTGADSTNTIDINIKDRERTDINNEADINTTVNAKAVTGQNDVMENTGGGNIKTGDASASASNVSIANTTVEGGNWGLVIVNSFNKWMGFLFGDNGEVKALSQEETIREIEARNSNTGPGSNNSVDIDIEKDRNTSVDNKAAINNEVNATAITGQNQSTKNTGEGRIETGDAHVQATTVNMANTTVKDASLFVSVINVMGNWWGDLFYGGQSLSGLAAAGNSTNLNAENSNTGANSENTVNVNVDREHETNVNNRAGITTALNADIDTGSNRANRNTMGGDIETGNGTVALNSQNTANLTAIAGANGLQVDLVGSNNTTGADSTNTITARINDDRVIRVNNNADVNTTFQGAVNTGNNEASRNTIGGNIVTGFADATVSIENMINQVLLGMSGGGVTVSTDLSNTVTGADSENINRVDIDKLTLIDILNRGLVNNLIDLFLNTGGNIASYNTQGGNISSGDACAKGHLHNDVNRYQVLGLGGASLNLDSEAEVHNETNIIAKTGDNELDRNTYAEEEKEKIPCPPKEKPKEEEPKPLPGIVDKEEPDKIAVQPTPTPVPSIEEKEEEEEKVPRVAAAIDKPRKPGIGGAIFRRFPVAGGEDMAKWMQGKSQSPWLLLLLTGLPILAWTYHLDRKKQALSWSI